VSLFTLAVRATFLSHATDKQKRLQKPPRHLRTDQYAISTDQSAVLLLAPRPVKPGPIGVNATHKENVDGSPVNMEEDGPNIPTPARNLTHLTRTLLLRNGYLLVVNAANSLSPITHMAPPKRT
jgi:hypothetical protein